MGWALAIGLPSSLAAVIVLAWYALRQVSLAHEHERAALNETARAVSEADEMERERDAALIAKAQAEQRLTDASRRADAAETRVLRAERELARVQSERVSSADLGDLPDAVDDVLRQPVP